jgi:hypothetical protein
MDNNRIANVKHRYTAWIEKNDKLFLDVIANPFMIDSQHKYLDWLIYSFTKGKVDLPLNDILNVLKRFDEVAGHLDRKNIYSYRDIYDVQSAVNAYTNREDKKEAAEIEAEKQQKVANEGDEESIYYTYTEFIDLLYEEIVQAYPKSFKVKGQFVVDGKYDTDTEGHIRLFYEIPYFNSILHIGLHLFDGDSPLTIQTQDMSAASTESKRRDFRLPYSDTAFKNRSLCFNLLEKSGNGVAMCLKLIEFSICLFIDSATFQQLFTVEYVYSKGSNRLLSKPIEQLLSYIKDKEEKGSPATKYDYVVNFLERPNDSVRGFQSQLFSDLKKAKVIDIKKVGDGYTYILGQNYHPFIEGRLRDI